MGLTLDEARRYADAAIRLAHERHVRVSVAVVDELGVLLQLDRMDGARLLGPDVATALAATALHFQSPTSAVAELGRINPDLLRGLQQTAKFAILPAGGGVPIERGGALVGAIGVSGTSAEEDEALARAALA